MKLAVIRILDWISKSLSLCMDFFGIKPVPKAILESFPDFDDQIFAMALSISKKKVPIIIFSNRARIIPKHWSNQNMDITLVKKKSLRALYYSKICKYAFFTHGSFLLKNPSKNQITVNLWHGIPLKKIGNPIGNKMPFSNFILATSSEMAYLIENAYSPHDVVPTVLLYGLPRTDLLEQKTLSNSVIRKLLWMPTYRKSRIGEIRNDGFINDLGVGLSIETLLELDNGLSKLGIKVELLLHPMAVWSIPNSFNAIEISEFDREKESLYRYINGFDGLITDYSSISIDYLVTQKPIFLFAPDYNEYLNTRGLNGDLELLLKLPINKSIEEILNSLEKNQDTTKELEAALSKWYDYLGAQRGDLIWNAINLK